MRSDRPALLFPGQGAHSASMLDQYEETPEFAGFYDCVCTILGYSPLQRIRNGDHNLINENAVSSVLTVLASVLSLEYMKKNGEPSPGWVTGYSVGQWTACYAAGCVTFDELIEIIKKRAELMDGCFVQAKGAMLAVIGIALEPIETLSATMREEGYNIVISNYNCFGQYSLSGTDEAIEQALARIVNLAPKKAVKLPVAGAWHSPMLKQAEDYFAAYLQHVPLKPPSVPVINNVTGELVGSDVTTIKGQMSKHLSHPVQWEKGIRTLLSLGCTEFVEVGFGNTLTKFGFFIDRSVKHRSSQVLTSRA